MTTSAIERGRPQGQLELFKALAADLSQAGIPVRESKGGVKSQGYIIECSLPPVGIAFEDKAILLFTPSQPRAGIKHPSLALSTMSFKPLESEAQGTGQLLRETWGSGVSLLPDDTLATFRQKTTDEVPETNILMQPGRNRVVSQILQGENPEVILGEIVLFEPGPDWFAKNKVREPILL